MAEKRSSDLGKIAESLIKVNSPNFGEIAKDLKTALPNWVKIMEGQKVEMPDWGKLTERLNANLHNLDHLQSMSVDPSVYDSIATSREEKIQREIKMVEALKTVAEVQPEIANTLVSLAEISDKTSNKQHRVNIWLIVISSIALILGIINVLFLFDVL